MIAVEFLDYLSKFQATAFIGVSDFSDRFNCIFTMVILLMACLIVTVKQYIMKPLVCYASTLNGHGLVDFMENLCWAEGTYYHNFSKPIPTKPEEWNKLDVVSYYQWIPFVLGLQCICFYIPHVIWQVFCYTRSGTDLQYLVSQAGDANRATSDTKEKILTFVVRSIERMIHQHREYRSGCLTTLREYIYRYTCFCLCSKRMGNMLVFSYFIIKCLYLFNGIGQILFVKHFLGYGKTFTEFGLSVLMHVFYGDDSALSNIFPRVTLCRAITIGAGTVHVNVAQCVLPANILNEKVYVFLWFWNILAVILTAWSILFWCFRVTNYGNRRFVQRLIHLSTPEDATQHFSTSQKFSVDISPQSSLSMCNYRQQAEFFISHFLRRDGVFLMQMISLNAGDVIAGEILWHLWAAYLERHLAKIHALHPDYQFESATHMGATGDVGKNEHSYSRMDVSGVGLSAANEGYNMRTRQASAPKYFKDESHLV